MAQVSIIGTGLTGMVGSRVAQLLDDRYTFESISRETGVDIADEESILQRIGKSDARLVLHLAAKTDVDACEKDRDFGKDGQAWQVNVIGTQNIVNACKNYGKRVIFISTDFIFDGTKNLYTEVDSPKPINWYGETKLAAEKIVQASGVPYVIARIAFPYRAHFEKKVDFVRVLKRRLEDGKSVAGVSDQVITPTFIDDIAQALDLLIQKEADGVYHVVGSQHVSPYEAALMIAKTFGLAQEHISKAKREDFFAGKAPRAFQLAINNDKIAGLGIRMRTFEEGLVEIKKQL